MHDDLHPNRFVRVFSACVIKIERGPRRLACGQVGAVATLSSARARTRVSFVRKSRLAGAGSLARRATGLHFHGARLADAYCIYLLTSKVNLPAPVHELYAHIRALAYQPDGRTQRPRARARAPLNDCNRPESSEPGKRVGSFARARARDD